MLQGNLSDQSACDAFPGDPGIRQRDIPDLISRKLRKHTCIVDGFFGSRFDDKPVNGIVCFSDIVHRSVSACIPRGCTRVIFQLIISAQFFDIGIDDGLEGFLRFIYDRFVLVSV